MEDEVRGSAILSRLRGTKRKLATMEESDSFSISSGTKRRKLATTFEESHSCTKPRKLATTLEESDSCTKPRKLATTLEESDSCTKPRKLATTLEESHSCTKPRKLATTLEESDSFSIFGGTKRRKLATTSEESDLIDTSCSSNNNPSWFHKTNSKSIRLMSTPRSSKMKHELSPIEKVSTSDTKRRKFSTKRGIHKTNSTGQNLAPSRKTDVMKEEGKCLNLVGMRDQLLEVDKLLDLGSYDVRFIGIVGMGGIGKTTIAKSVYKNLKPMFRYNCRCFLKVSGKKLVSLQNKLLSRLCGRKVEKTIKNNGHGAELIQNYLRRKKVVIVLDGVDDITKLKNLAGSPYWFRPGSRIIITTRNKNLYSQQPTSYEYNVKLLDHHSAFTLFCNHAFGVGYEPPDENFKYLAEEFVKMAQGHPSALITIGSHLHGKDIDIWEENIKTVDQLLYTRLFHRIFNTSYRGLDVETQQIFLDLACFFHNWTSVNRVIEILESFGYASSSTKLKSLAERNLINISFDNIQMHSLILCMGRGIAQGENGVTKSRFWLQEDIRRLFHEKEGLNQVRGIVFMEREEEEDELILEAKSFAYMTELQLLEINNNNIQISEEIKFLSNELRLLNWDGYPSKCLASNFEPPWLLELHLRNSQLERLWEGQKAFSCLKEMDLSGSEYLVETPDLSKLPKLERLILQNCVSLCVVHPSINTLDRLVLVDMAGCLSLKTFSSNPISSKSLQTLIFSDSGLESFPEIESCTKSLTELHVDGTLIQELPMSLGHLTALTLLNLRDCTKLSTLPESICRLMSLQTLNLNGCIDLHKIPFTLGTIPFLSKLDIGGTSLIDHHCDDQERLSRNNNIWWSLTGNNNNVLLLRDLNLSECNLVDEDIPNDLNCLSLLEILDLSKNSFVRLKQSLTQLTNLKALCLDDCIHLQPQLLPKFPTSLQYVGGLQNTNHISHNAQGSSISASSPSNPVRIVKEIESASDVTKDKYSPEEVDDDINNVKKTGKLISKLSTDHHSKFEKVCGKDLVGMEEQLENVRILLDINETDEARFVWICGVAGIGKTSIAEVIYSEIIDKFESSCFLHILEKKNLVSQQQQLLSQLLLKDEIEVLNEDDGAKMIENHMKSRRTLIVLDDIDEKRQVEKLVGSPDWFGPGSRIIITTRNRETVTRNHQLNYKMQEYNVKLLSQQSAHSLFCKYAFGNCVDREKNEYLSTEIVKNVGRLPGLLIFIGSALHNKDVAVWKETLTNLCNVQQDFFSAITN